MTDSEVIKIVIQRLEHLEEVMAVGALRMDHVQATFKRGKDEAAYTKQLLLDQFFTPKVD